MSGSRLLQAILAFLVRWFKVRLQQLLPFSRSLGKGIEKSRVVWCLTVSFKIPMFWVRVGGLLLRYCHFADQVKDNLPTSGECPPPWIHQTQRARRTRLGEFG